MNTNNLENLLVALKEQQLISENVYNNLASDYQAGSLLSDLSSWKDVRKLFFPKNAPSSEFDVEPMNSANLCPTFYPVLKSIEMFRSDFNQDISIQYRKKKFATVVKEVKNLIAGQIGVASTDLAFIRNTSEGNNLLSSCYRKWKPNTKVVLWDENHPTNNAAWRLKSRGKGAIEFFSLKEIDFTAPDEQVTGEILTEILNALKNDGQEAVMLSFSHISNVSGIQLPAREIITAVRSLYPDVHIHIDGAMSWGAKDLKLSALDCDSYTSSSHKWFMGPFETGIFYIKQEKCADFDINIFGYDGKVEVPDLDKLPDNASKFELIGQRDDANIYAMGKTAELHIMINKMVGNVQERVLFLQDKLIEILKARIPEVNGCEVSFLTPQSHKFSNGILFFKVHKNRNEIDHAALNAYLYGEENSKERFAVTTTTKGDYLRICPHIMNLEENLSSVVDKIVQFLKE